MAQSPDINTVMIIDDEEFDQVVYQRVLKKSGRVKNVIPFLYADEALEYLKNDDKKPIDVIFLDINIPRMNGFEFLEEATQTLTNNFAKAVVIMLTTALTPKDRERVAQFDVVKDYFDKPLSLEQIDIIASKLNSRNPS